MKKICTLPVFTGTLILLVGFGAVIGGFVLIFDPSGALLGMSPDLLEASPFKTFLLPGNVLYFIIGLGSLIVAFWTYKEYFYSGIATSANGLLLIAWIITQVLWIGWQNYLQPLLLVIGVVEMILGYAIDDHREDRYFNFRHDPRLSSFWFWTK